MDDKKREQARLRKQKQRDRERDIAPQCDTLSVTLDPDLSRTNVTPYDWEHVKEFIQRPPNSKMPNLEKLQRIAGSLGKNADAVWFGDLTMQDIGAVIGTLPPAISKDYR